MVLVRSTARGQLAGFKLDPWLHHLEADATWVEDPDVKDEKRTFTAESAESFMTWGEKELLQQNF